MPIMDGYEACKSIIEMYKRFEFQQLIYGDLENLQFQNEETHKQ